MQYRRPILITLVALYISSLFIYAIILVPRPYYIQSTDIENGYYYDARLIYNSLPTRTVTHPGTPLFYIYSKLFIFTGDDILSTQEFLRIIYFAQAILNILVLVAFVKLIPKTQNQAADFFALALILASPSFLTYQDYIGADAAIIIFGLPLLLMSWTLIEKEKKNIWLAILAFIYFGFVFAVKYSFLLLIVPAYIVLLVSSYLWKDWRGLKALLLCPILSIASFLFFISRIIYRLPALINQMIIRDNMSVDGIYGFIQALFLNVRYLFSNRPIFMLSLVTVILFFSAFVALYAAKFINREIIYSDEDKKIIPYLVFGFFGIAALAFTLVSSGDVAGNIAKGEELGVTLRNVALLLLLFPFIFLAARLIALRVGWELNKKIHLILLILGLLLISESVIKHIGYRNNMIRTNLERMAATEYNLMKFVPEGESFAIWSTDAKYAFGEESFHYWGNHKYAWNSFDEELRDIFNPIGFFQFRVAGQLVGQGRFDSIDRNYPLPEILQRNSFMAKLYLKWRNKFPPPKETDEIITGETFGEFPKAIIFPEAEREIALADENLLFKLLDYRSGMKTEKIAAQIEGRKWTILLLK